MTLMLYKDIQVGNVARARATIRNVCYVVRLRNNLTYYVICDSRLMVNYNFDSIWFLMSSGPRYHEGWGD